ncbi:MAG: tRNA lysidine(34) synthetase TilS [Aliishimia sp.]
MTLDSRVFEHLSCLFPNPSRIGVAVSGGSDSTALLQLTQRWAAQNGHRVFAVTVDHGLRAEAAQEAENVKDCCATLGVSHETLHWTDWDQTGNLQGAARAARYRLMAQWAKAEGVHAVLLGHTEDDIAETFLMRLARKSGVGGLSAMSAEFSRDGMRFLRPLLTFSRTNLREYLEGIDIDWIDDPSNDNPMFDRVKTRQTLQALTHMGLGSETIARSARALSDVKQAVVYYMRQEAHRRVEQNSGDLILDLSGDLPREIRRRLVSAGLHWFEQQEYPPRGAAMANLENALTTARQHTVAGVLVQNLADGRLRMTRELKAVCDLKTPTEQVWDNRWRIEGPHSPDLHVSALADGIIHRADWRDSGLARSTIMAAPSVWRGDTLVSAPILDVNTVWKIKIDTSFTDFLLSH